MAFSVTYMQLEGKYYLWNAVMCCLTALRYNLDVHMFAIFVGNVLIALQFGNLHQV